MKKVVVLGAGFAGIQAVLQLKRRLKNSNIVLIDRNKFHLFTPSLYEAATSEELKKNIAIPLELIVGEGIKIVKANIEMIDYKSNIVRCSDRSFPYDYLLIALGSEVSYFGIPGLKEHSYPLKTINDALKIKRIIRQKYHEKIDNNESGLKIIVGGGGFSGTELAAELIRYKDNLSLHHQKEESFVSLSIIQGSEMLLKELDKKVSEIAIKRLEQGKVKCCFNEHVKLLDDNFVYTDDGHKYAYDVFIWTGGIKATDILKESLFEVNKKGQLAVDDKMRVKGFNNIFAAGDAVCFADLKGNIAPNVVQVAMEEGLIAGQNIANSINNLPLCSYDVRHFGYIIPLKGHFAVAAFKNFLLSGILAFWLQQLVLLRYLFLILPFFDAFRRWNKFEQYLMQND